MDTKQLTRPEFQDEQETLPIFRAPAEPSDDEEDTIPNFNTLPFFLGE